MTPLWGGASEPPTRPRGRSVFVDGPQDTLLHLLEYGSPDAPPILIAPGITSPAVTWEFVVEHFEDQYRVFTLDIRGRGLSETGESFTLTDYAEDLRVVIETLKLDRPALIGHSAGALQVAKFGALHPESCGPLVIADPPMSGPGRLPYPTPLEVFVESIHKAQEGATADDMRIFFPSWTDEQLELRAAWLSSCDESAVVATYRGFHNEDLMEFWPRVPTPVIFIWGGESPVVGAQVALELEVANPAAVVVRQAGAGHMLPWDDLDGFVKVARTFLDPLLLSDRDT